MQLMTKGLLKEFEKQGQTDGKKPEDVKIIAKFFNPTGAGNWYATEWIPEDGVFFGYANIGDSECAELGYFSLEELQTYRGKFGLGIERDLHFHNRTLKEVLDARGTI